MKRIDDKISEIKKKDKRNQWLYVVIVALLIVFMGVVLSYENILGETKRELTKSEVEKSEYYKALLNEKVKVEQKKDSLEMSLRPEEYWEYIKIENSVEDYISYITNNWGIDKSKFINKAYDNLLTEDPNLVGYDGWIWVGRKKWSDEIYNSQGFIKIISRQNGEKVIEDSEPKIGDIIQLKTAKNRNTYLKNTCKGRTNEYGWRNKTKAIVVDIYHVPDKTDINIRIKYY